MHTRQYLGLISLLAIAWPAMAADKTHSKRDLGQLSVRTGLKGFNQCASTVRKLEQELIGSAVHGYSVEMDDDGKEDHMLEATIAREQGDTVSLIRFTVMPRPNGACDWSYTETTVHEKSCEAMQSEVATDQPAVAASDLGPRTLMISAEPRYILTPSAHNTACAVTRQQTFVGK